MIAVTEGMETCPRCGQNLHGRDSSGLPWELPTYTVRWQGELEEENHVMCEDCLTTLARRQNIDMCTTCNRWMWTGYLYSCPRCGKETCDECAGSHDYEGD